MKTRRNFYFTNNMKNVAEPRWVVIRLVSMGFFLLVTAGWTDAFKVSSRFAEGGGAQTPLSDMNYGYAFCDSDADARLAQSGLTLWTWKPDTVNEFCHHKVAGHDDSFKSGWERSRLFSGCRLRLNVFSNRVYRCFQFEQSDDYLSVRSGIARQIRDSTLHVEQVCAAKQDEITNSAGRIYGDIDAELRISKDSEREAEIAEQDAHQIALKAQHSIAENLEEIRKRSRLLALLAQLYDAHFSTLERDIQALFSNIKNADTELASYVDQVSKSDHSYSKLLDIQGSANRKLSEVQASVCQSKHFAIIIDGLRSQVAHMHGIVDGLEKRVSLLEVPQEFSADKDYILLQVKSLRDVPNERDAIFRASFDMLLERPFICQKIEQFNVVLFKALTYAKTIEEMTKTVGVIADMQAAFKQVLKDASTMATLESALKKAKTLEADLMRAIYDGQITKAKQIADSLDSTFGAITEKEHVANLDLDQDRIMQAIQPIKLRILSVVDSRLSIASAPSFLHSRLRSLKAKIIQVELTAPSSPELSSIWESRKDEILSSLKTSVGQDINRPELKDWASIAEYETLLSSIEATLEQLLPSKNN